MKKLLLTLTLAMIAASAVPALASDWAWKRDSGAKARGDIYPHVSQRAMRSNYGNFRAVESAPVAVAPAPAAAPAIAQTVPAPSTERRSLSYEPAPSTDRAPARGYYVAPRTHATPKYLLQRTDPNKANP